MDFLRFSSSLHQIAYMYTAEGKQLLNQQNLEALK